MADIKTWWASLSVTEKERIASKIAKKEVFYPECTAVWENLDAERKQAVMEHCTNAHGDVLKDWFDGKPYGD